MLLHLAPATCHLPLATCHLPPHVCSTRSFIVSMRLWWLCRFTWCTHCQSGLRPDKRDILPYWGGIPLHTHPAAVEGICAWNYIENLIVHTKCRTLCIRYAKFAHKLKCTSWIMPRSQLSLSLFNSPSLFFVVLMLISIGKWEGFLGSNTTARGVHSF